MAKRILFLLLIACAGAIGAATYTDPLEKPVAGGYSIKSFDDAVHQIEERTGFKVSCPKDLKEFMQTTWIAGGVGNDKEPQGPVHLFLNQMIRGSLALDWKFDPRTNTATLEMGWITSDSRTPEELLKCCWKPEHNSLSGKNPEWQKTFDALLSQPLNFGKAWRVRQRSCYENLFRSSMMFPNARPTVEAMDCLLVRRMVSESLHPYIVVVIRHPMQICPGHGSISYYWFKEDGTLEGAGLLTTGHRCNLFSGTVEPNLENDGALRSVKEASELRLIVGRLDPSEIARFTLTDNGLKLIAVTDQKGNSEPPEDIGKSLMEPTKQ